jgi:hypothetical protein
MQRDAFGTPRGGAIIRCGGQRHAFECYVETEGKSADPLFGKGERDAGDGFAAIKALQLGINAVRDQIPIGRVTKCSYLTFPP